MKKIYLVLSWMCLLFLGACNPEVDAVFDGTSSSRMSEALKAHFEKLTGASNGWLMEYYPSNIQRYGGYNVLASFSKDGHVTVSADIADPSATATSLFRLKEQSGPTLTIDSYNKIFHFFSDPASGVGQTGLGMEGDYEFTIMSSTEEQVILKGKKTNNRIVMTALPDDFNWQDYLVRIGESESKIKSKYDCKVGDMICQASSSYRTFSFSFEENGEMVTRHFSYIQTLTGVKFYEPVQLNGVSVTELKYQEKGKLVSEDGSLVMVPIPPKPADLFLQGGPWFVTFAGTSASLQNMMALGCEKIKQGIGFYPDFYIIGSYLYHDYSLNLVAGDTAGALLLESAAVDGNTVALALVGRGDNQGVAYWNCGGAYLFQAIASMGNPKMWNVEPNDADAPTSFKMTEVGNPDNVIVVTSQETSFGYK